MAGVAAVGLCTVPASAHASTWSVSCSEVTVDLTAYNGGVTNTVSISVDGKDLLAAKSFGSEYHDKISLPEHTSELPVHLVVKAGDGKQFSRDETKTAPVCAGTPTAQPSMSPTPTQAPSSEAPAPAASSASAAPVPSSKPSSANLAETGSSSSTPIIAGAAAVVVVAGGGIMLATRKRAAARR